MVPHWYKCNNLAELPYKSSMETMLYLFGIYLDNEVSCRQKQQLRVLKNYVGDKHSLLNGSNGTKVVTGIKLSSGNGFPECLREAVITNEGEDLSGFCRPYRFSAFVSRFEDPTFDPLQEYGDSTKELRLMTSRQLKSKGLVLLTNDQNGGNKRDPAAATAKKVAECFRDQFNPKKSARDLTVEERLNLLVRLEKAAAGRGETILTEIRLNKDVVEKLIIKNKGKDEALDKLWKENEPKRKRAKPVTSENAAKSKAVLGPSTCQNVEEESKRARGRKRSASDGASNKAERKKQKGSSCSVTVCR